MWNQTPASSALQRPRSWRRRPCGGPWPSITRSAGAATLTGRRRSVQVAPRAPLRQARSAPTGRPVPVARGLLGPHHRRRLGHGGQRLVPVAGPPPWPVLLSPTSLGERGEPVIRSRSHGAASVARGPGAGGMGSRGGMATPSPVAGRTPHAGLNNLPLLIPAENAKSSTPHVRVSWKRSPGEATVALSAPYPGLRRAATGRPPRTALRTPAAGRRRSGTARSRRVARAGRIRLRGRARRWWRLR